MIIETYNIESGCHSHQLNKRQESLFNVVNFEGLTIGVTAANFYYSNKKERLAYTNMNIGKRNSNFDSYDTWIMKHSGEFVRYRVIGAKQDISNADAVNQVLEAIKPAIGGIKEKLKELK